jgi:cellulose biosynthesis protein BcsQ
LIEWLLPLSDEGLLKRLLRLFKIRDSEIPESNRDLRYLLAEAVLDPQVQSNFDVIIIDSPPRLTTSHIQAMCASTHLLVPTILDGLTSDAVGRYLDQVAVHKLGALGESGSAICPHLQALGVVVTLLPITTANLEGRLNVLGERISAARLKPEIVPQACFIRQRTPYRDCAGERLAYAADVDNQAYRDLRDEVDMLGDWLGPRLGSVPRGWRRR